MKKLLSFLLTMTLVFSLAACGGAPQSTESEDAAPTSALPSPSEASAQPAEAGGELETPSPTAQATQTGGILIAYFSWSGNTEQVARIIQQETGGDLFEIATATPYTDDYNELLDIAQQEQAEGARPELAGQVENWDSYDVVFVGYPNWWSDAPMAVYAFLESYDFTGKTLVPFNTSSSGGFGRSLSGLEEGADGATVLEGLAITQGNLENAQSEVTAWLDSLNLE